MAKFHIPSILHPQSTTIPSAGIPSGLLDIVGLTLSGQGIPSGGQNLQILNDLEILNGPAPAARPGIPSGLLDIVGLTLSGKGIPTGRTNLQILNDLEIVNGPAPEQQSTEQMSDDFMVFGNVVPIDSHDPNDGTAGDDFLVFGALFSFPDGGLTESGTTDFFGDDDLVFGGYTRGRSTAYGEQLRAQAAAGTISYQDWIVIPHQWRDLIWGLMTPANQQELLKRGSYKWLRKKDRPSKGPIAAVGRAVKAVAIQPAKAAIKIGKKVIRSPIVKVAAGAAAIVFPPVGMPVAAGLAIGDRALRVAEGTKGTPAQQQAMRRAISNTATLAKKGNPGAKAALEQIALAKKLRLTQQARAAKRGGRKAIEGTLVSTSNKILKGSFIPA